MSVESPSMDDASGLRRIGSFSRSVGVTPETLRAWEDRYGLPAPSRSSGGFRLYSRHDATLVAAMKRHLQAGLAASDAARHARELAAADGSDPGTSSGSELDQLRVALSQACLAFDSSSAHRCLDGLVARLSLDAVLRDGILPFVVDLDRRHQRGEITKAQAQFSARLIEARLVAMASGWELGHGPLALVARGPAERHVIGITALGLALRARGWRVVSLGSAVRAQVLADAAQALKPEVVALSIGTTRPRACDQETLRALATTVPLALGGRAATARLAAALGAQLLQRDAVSAAADVVARYASGALTAAPAG